jgi:hypothetical protein
MKQLKTFYMAVLSTMLMLVAGAASADVINVDIYSGFQDSGSGAPYYDYAGNISAPDVMFASSTGYAWHPLGLGSFGADITGFLCVADTDNYTFTLNSDDGSMLFIGGILVIDNGGPHIPRTQDGTVNLSAGSHSFEVQFFEDYGGESGVDLYLPEGVSYVPEPATMVFLGLGALSLIRRKRSV